MKYLLFLPTLALCSCTSPVAKALTSATINSLERRQILTKEDAEDLRLGKEIVFIQAPEPVTTLPTVDVTGSK